MKKIVILFLASLPLLVSGQHLSGQADNSISVEGKFVIREVPEQIEFTFTVRYTGPNFKTTSDSLMIITRRFTDILTRSGIGDESIRVSAVLVSENFVYRHGERTREGFTGSSVIMIREIMTQELTRMIFSSMSLFDHDLEYSVRFSLSEEQKERLRKLSLEGAMDDATQKAAAIAAGSKLQLVRINRIFSGDMPMATGWQEFGLAQMDMVPITRQEEFPDLQLNPAEVSISSSIIVEWIIRAKK